MLYYSCFEIRFQNIPMKSFKGCLRNFKVNGKVMNAPQQKNGVLPCLDVPMDTGIYFFNEGGYITIGKLCTGYGIWNYVWSVYVYGSFVFTWFSNYLLLWSFLSPLFNSPQVICWWDWILGLYLPFDQGVQQVYSSMLEASKTTTWLFTWKEERWVQTVSIPAVLPSFSRGNSDLPLLLLFFVTVA